MSLKVVRRGVVLAASLSVLALAGSASAASLHGVVVQHNRLAHSFVLALSRGRLVSIHSRRSPAVGRVVTVRAQRLRNGTYSLRHVVARQVIRRRVVIHGVVTFVNRRRGEFTVSAGGASLLVRRAGVTGLAADIGPGTSLPSVGDEVSVETAIDDQGNLNDQGVQSTGTETQNVQVEGTVLSVDPTTNTLTISADDEDQSGQSITVAVPPTIDITQFQVGQQVELTVSVQSDGSLLLQGSSEDGDSGQANNPGDQQGCEGDGPDNSCGQPGTGSGDSQGGSGSDGSGTSGSDQGGSGSDTSGGDGSDQSGSGSDSSGSGDTGSGSSGSGDSGSGSSGS
jgi:uncharacterized membrane protein YgcG